jgi:PHD/YefM family antitoxin component YafN of YafNO toxin-antitoxin module
MYNLFEDYREIRNVRDNVDLILELVQTAPRRVFLTEQGKVQAVVLSARDYELLWRLELEHDMKIADEESAAGQRISFHDFRRELQEAEAKRKKQE